MKLQMLATSPGWPTATVYIALIAAACFVVWLFFRS